MYTCFIEKWAKIFVLFFLFLSPRILEATELGPGGHLKDYLEWLVGYYSAPAVTEEGQADFDLWLGRLENLSSKLEDLDSITRVTHEVLFFIQAQRIKALKFTKGDVEKKYKLPKSDYQQAVALEKAIEPFQNDPSVSALTLQAIADLKLFLLPHVSYFRIGSYGAAAQRFHEEALKKDPHWIASKISLAAIFLFAPRLFGGDASKAQRYAQEAYEDSKDSLSRFLSLIWLAQVEASGQRYDKSKEYLHEAEKIFPKSSLLEYVKNLHAQGKLLR